MVFFKILLMMNWLWKVDSVDLNKKKIKQVHLKKRKTSTTKECIICHYWYFSKKGFDFQSSDCNRFYEAILLSIKLSSIDFLSINGIDYRCTISEIRKSEAINLWVKELIIKHRNFFTSNKVDKKYNFMWQ